MSEKTICGPLACALLLLVYVHSDAQRTFLNTTSNVYEIIGTPGHYTYKNMAHFCLEDTSDILSTAMHGDTMYLITPTSNLYRELVSAPGSCQYLGSLADPPLMTYFESLACDKNGILYTTGATGLYRYDPHTNELTHLGILPVNPDGDLVFYGDVLLCPAGGEAIYAINIQQPSASVKFKNTPGYQFWGMAAMPGDCNRNRLFGLSGGGNAKMVEIDPVAKTIIGVVIDSSFQHILPLPGTIATAPALCVQRNGSSYITLNAGTDPSTITTSLNTGTIQFSLALRGLGAGIDTLHV